MIEKLKNYIKNTWKNKIASVVLMAVGYLSMKVSGDGTAFVFLTMLAMPLFFIKENVVVLNRKDGNE